MMKFDTRDKKPTVYNILFLTLVAAVMIAVLWFMKVDDIILYSIADCLKYLLRSCLLHRFPEKCLYIVIDASLEKFLIKLISLCST